MNISLEEMSFVGFPTAPENTFPLRIRTIFHGNVNIRKCSDSGGEIYVHSFILGIENSRYSEEGNMCSNIYLRHSSYNEKKVINLRTKYNLTQGRKSHRSLFIMKIPSIGIRRKKQSVSKWEISVHI